MTSYGNGGYKPIPTNIWSSSVPNGTYGACIPAFGSLGNSNTTPQISSQTVIKGNGYVRYEDNQTGRWTTVSSNGMRSNG
jgi:hypothetical protein